MPLLNSQVEQIARLARLKLTPAEVDRFARDLTVILEYVDQLQAIDTSHIEPQAKRAETTNVFRADEVRPSLSQAEALANAPRQDGEFFLVPKVLG